MKTFKRMDVLFLYVKNVPIFNVITNILFSVFVGLSDGIPLTPSLLGGHPLVLQDQSGHTIRSPVSIRSQVTPTPTTRTPVLRPGSLLFRHGPLLFGPLDSPAKSHLYRLRLVGSTVEDGDSPRQVYEDLSGRIRQ